MITNKQKIRSILKWPGGKFRLISDLKTSLDKTKNSCLIEPFLGSGVLFLNTNYEEYILNDSNKDLISLYKIVQRHPKEFISKAKHWFQAKYNQEKQYYKLRDKFNNLEYDLERASIFLYLNRHGYNGLVRYNKSKNFYNVPFGRYEKPYFPENELNFLIEKLANTKTKFYNLDFNDFFKKIYEDVDKRSIIYCDPPYLPISKTSNFTQYQGLGFDLNQHKNLANWALKFKNKKVSFLISNHDLKIVRNMYKDANFLEFKLPRIINCIGSKRKNISEILARF